MSFPFLLFVHSSKVTQAKDDVVFIGRGNMLTSVTTAGDHLDGICAERTKNGRFAGDKRVCGVRSVEVSSTNVPQSRKLGLCATSAFWE